MDNTYDRFLGSWWGGIIAQSSIAQSDSSFKGNLFTQHWLKRRSQIAEMLLRSQPNNLAQLIKQSTNTSEESGKYIKYNCNMLSLLPLIIFDSEGQNFTLESLNKRNLSSANLVKDSYVSPNVLLWSYLLITVLNHQTDLLRLKLTREAIFDRTQVDKSPVVKKLRLVETAIERGTTFEELKAKLSTESLQSTAIALSWYCFVSTPYDPKLSIQRAARVQPNLAWLTTALTGTLSGAYNGMARISVNWRIDSELNPQKSQEHNLFIKLYKFWSGIYAIDSDVKLWNCEVNAIAPARSIQPRSSLRIISQLSLYR